MDYRFEYLVDMVDSIIASLRCKDPRRVDTLDGATMLSAIAGSIYQLEASSAALHSPALYLQKLVREDLCKTVDELIQQHKHIVTFKWTGDVKDREQLERVCRNHIQYMLHKAIYKCHMLVSEYAPTTVSIVANSTNEVSVAFIDKHDHILIETNMRRMSNMWVCLDDLPNMFYKVAEVGATIWWPEMPIKNIKYMEET